MDAPAPALSHSAGRDVVLAGVDATNEVNKRKLSESCVAVDNNSVDMMEMN